MRERMAVQVRTGTTWHTINWNPYYTHIAASLRADCERMLQAWWSSRYFGDAAFRIVVEQYDPKPYGAGYEIGQVIA